MLSKLSKRAKIIILIILVLVLVTLVLQGRGLRLPTNTGAPSDFNVSDQVVPQVSEGLTPDDSNLFHSPRAVSDDGIYYPQNPPTFAQSSAEIDKVRSKLPIYIDNIRTSAGLTTSVNINIRAGSRPDVLSIHVLGINFNEGEASDSNPQYKAFVESLQRAKSELQKSGVDTTKILVSFGTRQYEVNTANNWARTSGTL